ncbi:Uncharacterised protein [Acinetobacter baumannii]|nr:Uncharacterised protein [Acinetobacter baumannii]
MRDRLIIARVLTIRSSPFTARNSVCTGITRCWLAARALTISTPSSGGLSMIAWSKSCQSCARLFETTRPRPLLPGDWRSRVASAVLDGSREMRSLLVLRSSEAGSPSGTLPWCRNRSKALCSRVSGS